MRKWVDLRFMPHMQKTVSSPGKGFVVQPRRLPKTAAEKRVQDFGEIIVKIDTDVDDEGRQKVAIVSVLFAMAKR